MASIVERPMAESIEQRPPTQSQKTNMLAVSIPNFSTSAVFVDTAGQNAWQSMFHHRRDARAATLEPVWALVIVSSVVKVFEEIINNSLRRVQAADRFREVRAINIGNEPEGHGALAVMFERFVGHHRPEIGATNPDVDHIAECAFRCAPFHSPLRTRFEKAAILSSTPWT